ncbi:MAG: transcription elongation factor GreA [Tissierellia bacterium]|nr:transcription elongation factor GreA [Tissierellia bacterium]
MAEKDVFLTVQGLEKLEKELENLKTIQRREVADKIKVALSFGDISENSEYDQAKNEQAQLEERIIKLENTLRNAKIIDEDDISTDVVSVGSKVEVLDVEYDEKMKYIIVGSAEADPFEGKISNQSPVGNALIGGKTGDEVDVHVPDGIIKYKILSITR